MSGMSGGEHVLAITFFPREIQAQVCSRVIIRVSHVQRGHFRARTLWFKERHDGKTLATWGLTFHNMETSRCREGYKSPRDPSPPSMCVHFLFYGSGVTK